MKTSRTSRYVAIIVEVTIERARAYPSTYQRQKNIVIFSEHRKLTHP